jgi:hypothetical protein
VTSIAALLLEVVESTAFVQGLEPSSKGAFRVVVETWEAMDQFAPNTLRDLIDIDSVAEVGSGPAFEHRAVAVYQFGPSRLVIAALHASQKGAAGPRFSCRHDGRGLRSGREDACGCV